MRANGIPPPGCTLPPQKNKDFILRRKVFVTEKCSKPTILKYRTRNPYKNMFYLVSVVVLVALQTG
jgi:hypothetical protein